MKYWTIQQEPRAGKGIIVHWVRENIWSRAACGYRVGDKTSFWDGAEITCTECRRLYEEYITESGGGSQLPNDAKNGG